MKFAASHSYYSLISLDSLAENLNCQRILYGFRQNQMFFQTIEIKKSRTAIKYTAINKDGIVMMPSWGAYGLFYKVMHHKSPQTQGENDDGPFWFEFISSSIPNNSKVISLTLFNRRTVMWGVEDILYVSKISLYFARCLSWERFQPRMPIIGLVQSVPGLVTTDYQSFCTWLENVHIFLLPSFAARTYSERLYRQIKSFSAWM